MYINNDIRYTHHIILLYKFKFLTLKYKLCENNHWILNILQDLVNMYLFFIIIFILMITMKFLYYNLNKKYYIIYFLNYIYK
jgi:hypothetical protein